MFLLCFCSTPHSTWRFLEIQNWFQYVVKPISDGQKISYVVWYEMKMCFKDNIKLQRIKFRNINYIIPKCILYILKDNLE